MPHLTIFGAGPATGLSTARRFARDGYDVSLVGRTPATLDALATELADAGTRVATVVADLADPARDAAALAEVEAVLGLPDVVVYAPGDVDRLPVDVRSLDADVLAGWLPLNLLSPVALAHAVVPRMAERGSGALVVLQGMAVRTPMPALASSSVAQAGTLNYLRALAADVAARGVRVASLQVGQLIERSAAARLFDAGHFADVEPGDISRIDPDVLAGEVWELVHGAEVVVERAS